MLVFLLLITCTVPTKASSRMDAIPSTIPRAYQVTGETSGKETNTVSYVNHGQNLSLLEPGDIAFKRPQDFPIILNHCVLYIGYNESTRLYIFIEANSPSNKVQYRYENESTLLGPLYRLFAKVRHANSSQKQNAIDFVKRQLGKPFQYDWINKNYNPEDTENDSLADEWYCSELVWAAYYNCNHPFPELEPDEGYVYGDGIDLDRNGWKKNFLGIITVHPLEILFNFYEVKLFTLKNNYTYK